MKANFMLLSDYYKQGHKFMYPKGMEYMASYGTARDSRLRDINKMVSFGQQAFAKEYLIELANETFFNRPKQEVLDEIKFYLDNTFNYDKLTLDHIAALHDLGYLPVRMWAIPEGIEIPIYKQKENPGVVQVPFMMYENTHPDFAWVAEFLESITSSEIWYRMLIATVTKYGYRDTVDRHWEKSVDNQPAATAISEFGFRGGQGLEGAVMASTAFLTSFNKTATIPANIYLKKYYNAEIRDGKTASGMMSSEHSTMCSNFAIDGNEDTFMERLFTEVCPNGNLSVVSDSYDYWGRIREMCRKGGKVHEAILNRNGTTFVRGDSGDPVDIVCGDTWFHTIESIGDIGNIMDEIESHGVAGEFKFRLINKTGDPFKYYKVTRIKTDVKCNLAEEYEPELHELGTVEALYNGFGGQVNSKGYIVLNPKIRAIYGDSITPARAEDIYSKLEAKGFAANNVALGAGSFSMQAWEEKAEGEKGRELKPYTRDTFGVAFKATYCEANGKSYQIFKDPATDENKFKRSQRGMVVVIYDEDGKLKAVDGYNREQFNALAGVNVMRPIFENGKMIVDEKFDTIRHRLNPSF